MALQPAHHQVRPLITCVVLAISSVIAPLAAQAQDPPKEEYLVRRTVQNEIDAGKEPASFMYRDRKKTAHGSETRLIVETKQASAAMLVAVDGEPLTTEQRRVEKAHLDHLLNNPDELTKMEKSEKEEADHITRIMRALPDAFIYQADGAESGREGVGKTGDELVRLKFHPNPNYHPPTRVEQVLAGMQGYMLIDANRHRIARIDGTLIKEVAFGWGILGHLNKEGHFLVEQADVGAGVWEITRMNLAFTGRALIVKSINISSDEVFSDFRPAARDLTFAQGVELLRKAQSQPAENDSGAVRR